MEDKYYKSIMNILQDYVNDYCCEYYQEDSCPPKYTVSINNENMGDQKILLTIEHCGEFFTNTIFPRDDSFYGYDGLDEMMVDMYNQTM